MISLNTENFEGLAVDVSLSTPSPEDPLLVIQEWLDEAINKDVQRHPNAMTLATADSSHIPRIS